MRTSQLTSALVALLSILRNPVSASLNGDSINVGKVNGNDVAWAGGSDPCKNNYIDVVDSGAFCGTDFTVNGRTYKLAGCGCGILELRNQDGSFNAPCYNGFTYTKDCGNSLLTQTWSCHT